MPVAVVEFGLLHVDLFDSFGQRSFALLKADGQIIEPAAFFTRFSGLYVRRNAGLARDGLPRRPFAEGQDFKFNGADVQVVAGGQGGVGKRLMVQKGIGSPAADDRSGGTAKDQAVERSDAGRPESQRALGAGADGAFARF